MELGIFIKDAMQSAGKPFAELSPGEIGQALREYEVLRSHRVSHIIAKSGFIGNLFLFMGFLVSTLLGTCRRSPVPAQAHSEILGEREHAWQTAEVLWQTSLQCPKIDGDQ